MWSFFQRGLSGSARRSTTRRVARSQELDRREMLSAAVVQPIRSTVPVNSAPNLGLLDYNNRSALISQPTETGQRIVAPSVEAGATLISYYKWDDIGATTVRLTGNRGGAFGIQSNRVSIPTSDTGRLSADVSSLMMIAPSGSIYVANPRALRPGSRFELKLIVTDAQGASTSKTIEVIIPNSTVAVTAAENTSDGTVLGALPPELSRGRMRTTILTNSYVRSSRNWIPLSYLSQIDYGLGYSSPVRVQHGQIIATPSPEASLQVDGHDRRFNFEETQGNAQGNARVSGHTVLQVFDRITRRTEYVVVALQLTNVDERSSMADHHVNVGLQSGSSQIEYHDPDGNRSDEVHQMRIIAGDPDGLFEIKNELSIPPSLWNGVPSYSPFHVAAKDPSRVDLNRQYVLTVELLEDGEVVGTAELTVRVAEGWFYIDLLSTRSITHE